MAERNEMMQQNQKQNIEQKYYYTVMEEQEGMRLDQFLAGELKEHSRSYIQKLIKEGRVTVGDKKEKPGCRLKVEDSVVICVPPLKELEVLPEKMDLDIIYEDEDVILINKPKDMVVHPCPGRYTGTLVNGLLYHCRDNLSGINGVLRPGQEEGTVDAPIGRSPADRKKMAVEPKNGKRAVTHYKVLSHLNHQFNHIECQLETGRTHQIRVHMASIRHPLLGDTTYGPKNAMGLTGQCLHARVLGFIHPRTGEYVEFEAPLPEYFQKLLEKYS